MRKARKTGFVLLLFSLICTASHAGDRSDYGDWEFNLAPFYLWAVDMNGELTKGTISTPVEADFKDIVSGLQAVFTGHLEAVHKTGWGFLADVNYLDLGGQQTIPILVPITLDVDLTSVMMEFAGIYRFDLGENAFDVIGGARYTSLEPKIDITTALPLPSKIEKKQDWWDAVIGGRYIWTISERWRFLSRADVGTFGSDLTWNLSGLLEFQPWEHISLIGGYRYMDIDYDDGSGATLFKYDMTMAGPVAAVNFVW